MKKKTFKKNISSFRGPILILILVILLLVGLWASQNIVQTRGKAAPIKEASESDGLTQAIRLKTVLEELLEPPFPELEEPWAGAGVAVNPAGFAVGVRSKLQGGEKRAIVTFRDRVTEAIAAPGQISLAVNTKIPMPGIAEVEQGEFRSSGWQGQLTKKVSFPRSAVPDTMGFAFPEPGFASLRWGYYPATTNVTGCVLSATVTCEHTERGEGFFRFSYGGTNWVTVLLVVQTERGEYNDYDYIWGYFTKPEPPLPGQPAAPSSMELLERLKAENLPKEFQKVLPEIAKEIGATSK